MTLTRYQTRGPSKSWHQSGPDLLRTLDSALDHLNRLERHPRYTSRRLRDGTWGEWRPLPKTGLGPLIHDLTDDGTLKIAGADKEATGYVLARVIPVTDYPGATPLAETTNALMRAAFPTTAFAGIFVCKITAGTSSWSDHAWGDAVDRSGGDTAALFSWCVRMARAGLLGVELIIGPIRGVVHEASVPRFTMVVGGDSSHLWHVHASCRQHDGTPPCA